MRPQPSNRGTPAWVWALAIAAGVGGGLLVRSLLSAEGPAAPAGTTETAISTVRCPDPSGGELALSESVTPGVDQASAASVVYARRYTLERPAQAAFTFDGGGDRSSEALKCDRVRFGPGARVAFGRGPEAFVVELVGPQVRRFDAADSKDLTALVVDPRWKLRLRLEDYAARAPEINDKGVGRLVLERTAAPDPSLPNRIVLGTSNSGASWSLDRQATLASVSGG